jgi:hypothetical protein
MYRRYTWYLVRHKWFVLMAGRTTGVPLWQLFIHDWSKFLPDEYVPYARRFFGPAPATEAVRAAFDRAWRRHQHRQPHHWQHWCLREDAGNARALPMPERFMREMVADWMGASRASTGSWDVLPWYTRNRTTIVLHLDTRRRVETLLGLDSVST